MQKSLLTISIIFFFINAIAQNEFTNISYEVNLRTFSDAEYPDNNQIGFKSMYDGKYSHDKIRIEPNIFGNYKITIFPSNQRSDTIILPDVNLAEYIPTIPSHIKSNPYLVHIALMNQEWNRVQVKYNEGFAEISKSGNEDSIISRIDIANNCLRKGLWELQCYTLEGNRNRIYFQSWFDFPEELYNDLFYQRNGIGISKYDSLLKNYVSPGLSNIDLNAFRTIKSRINLRFTNYNSELYPLTADRQNKAKNIIYPNIFISIHDYLSDKTAFASFIDPGIYTKKVIRNTNLSKFQIIDSIVFIQSISKNEMNSHTSEFQFYYRDSSSSDYSKLIIGGIFIDHIPVLKMTNHQMGMALSMGISNHPFENKPSDLTFYSTKNNPYFGLLLNERNQWIDSHEVGIDGVLFFRDEDNHQLLHIFILSYERFVFIGHYVLNLPK